MMGRASAEDIIQSGRPVDEQLAWHLEYNHFPPVTQSMVPFCREAIELVAGDQGETKISVGIPGSQVEIAAYKIVDDLHLESWVDAMRFVLSLDVEDCC